MDIRIKFLGGAGSVTGSKFLLSIDGFRLLIDCGLFQGLKELRLRNWDDLSIDPSSIDSVVITHAHIDHSGYLPLLVKNGYHRYIHCTEPTMDLMNILLTDSAKLQEEEAAFANKKGYSKHHPAKPLYTVKEAQRVFPLIKTHVFNEWFRVHDQVEVRFFQAGHILGAASVEVKVFTNQGEKILIFSGDLGPFDNPLHMPPQCPSKADILLMESTYGARINQSLDIERKLKDLLKASDRRGGCIVIPAFSVGRTQLILYYLWKVFQQVGNRPVYVDSPMSISVTQLYKKYTDYHRLSPELCQQVFDAPFIHYVTEQSQSRSLNTVKRKAIIISASGMATGGRVLHHLYHRLPNEQDIILFVGFQAIGSRGRDLVEGRPSVRIFGEDVLVKAQVLDMHGLSAHADQEQLLTWATHLESTPKMTFLIHGENEQSEALSQKLTNQNWNVSIPKYQESVTLFDHI